MSVLSNFSGITYIYLNFWVQFVEKIVNKIEDVFLLVPLKQGHTVELRLTLSSLYTSGWPWTHDLPGSASHSVISSLALEDTFYLLPL
jgi:hypothetical protein